MRTRVYSKALAFCAALAIGTMASAAGPTSPQQGAEKGAQGHHGMMGDGMMGGGGMTGGGGMGGMMDMMKSCQSMMGNSGMSGTAMPKFPPGNERLETQMHAEMMQKMGEIAARYAERIQTR